MKIKLDKINTSSSKNFESVGFDIGNKAVIMEILRGRMYSNPIKAICQEIMSNARDAHREVGKHRTPIEVVFPTELDSTFTIRDFGPGITQDRMAEIYVMYGESTKRDSNKMTGGWGLGSKTPFSYSDTFSVISITPDESGQLIKRDYVAYVDESRLGVMSLVSEEITEEPRGTAVIVTVKSEDRREFVEQTKHTAKYWKVKPNIKNEEICWENEKKLIEGNNWYIIDSKKQQANIAIIDGIQYQIDIENVFKEQEKINMFYSAGIRAFFKTGEIDVTATREDIDYRKKTIAKLRKVFLEMAEYISKYLSDKIANANNINDAVKFYNLARRELKRFSGNITALWNNIDISNVARHGIEFKQPEKPKIEITDNIQDIKDKEEEPDIFSVTSFCKKKSRRYPYDPIITRGISYDRLRIIPEDDTVIVENDIEKNPRVRSRVVELLSDEDLKDVYVFSFEKDSNGNEPGKQHLVKTAYWDLIEVKKLSELPLPIRDRYTPDDASKPARLKRLRYDGWEKVENVSDIKVEDGKIQYYVVINGNRMVLDDSLNGKPACLVLDIKESRKINNHFGGNVYGVFKRFVKYVDKSWVRLSKNTIAEHIAKQIVNDIEIQEYLKYGHALDTYETPSWLNEKGLLKILNKKSPAYEMISKRKSCEMGRSRIDTLNKIGKMAGLPKTTPKNTHERGNSFRHRYPLLNDMYYASNTEEIKFYIEAKDKALAEEEEKKNAVQKPHSDSKIDSHHVRSGATCYSYEEERQVFIQQDY